MGPASLRGVVLLLVLGSLPGCGLFPPLGGPPVESLQGKVENGNYTAPDGSFAVRIPQTDSYEYRWMEAKERDSEHEFYVSFGPAAFDKSIYRVGISKGDLGVIPKDDLAAAARRIVDEMSKQLQPMTGTPPAIQAQSERSVAGRPGYHLRLTQAAPAGTVSSEAATIVHDSLLVRHDRRMLMVWVQTYDGWPQRGAKLDDFVGSIAVD